MCIFLYCKWSAWGLYSWGLICSQQKPHQPSLTWPSLSALNAAPSPLSLRVAIKLHGLNLQKTHKHTQWTLHQHTHMYEYKMLSLSEYALHQKDNWGRPQETSEPGCGLSGQEDDESIHSKSFSCFVQITLNNTHTKYSTCLVTGYILVICNLENPFRLFSEKWRILTFNNIFCRVFFLTWYDRKN